MARNVDYNINVNDQGSLNTLGQLEERAALLNAEIRLVDQSSQEFATLTSRLQEVNHQLGQANSQIEGFTERRRIQALQGTIDIFGGGVVAAQGLAVSLGLSNDEFEETIQNLLAVQASAQGIRTVTQGIADLREATKGLTLAQIRFNVAALANPYVAAAAVIVVAISALVAEFDEFKEALGDVGVDLPAFGEIFDKVTDILSTGAVVIARGLGYISRGIISFIRGDFEGAAEAFGNLFDFESLSTRTSSEEPSEQFKNTLNSFLDEISSVTEGTFTGDEGIELLQTFGVPIPDEEVLENSLETIREYNKNIGDIEEGRAQRAIDGLRGAFGENVELQKALTIAEGAYQAGKSVTQTVSSIRTIISTSNAAAAAADAILPGSGTPIRVRGSISAGVEGALGAVDLASITQNTIQTINALEQGAVFNPTGSLPAQGNEAAFGPTVAVPQSSPSEVPDSSGVATRTTVVMQDGLVFATPTSGPGSFEAARVKNEKRRNRRRLGS